MPKLRTISRLSVIALVVVVGSIIGLRNLLVRSQAAPVLVAGTVLSGTPAPSFALRDQSGALVALDRLRGRPVVLTFLDATCTPACPHPTDDLDRTAQFLGAQAKEVAWLALSVDPATTPADASAFLASNKVVVPLHILLGTEAQLAPLWQAYSIAVAPSPEQATQHTIVTYLVDRRGREREVLDEAYDARLAAQDLRVLLTG
jgi:cytochrome oxidase Cu insertion factor (SCO1/SenC/PrrC family)